MNEGNDAPYFFGPLGAMEQIWVEPGVSVESTRGSSDLVVGRGTRYFQQGRTAAREWKASFNDQTQEATRLISMAANGMLQQCWLYDIAEAQENMVPADLSAGSPSRIRKNLATNPSFENGTGQSGGGIAAGGGATVAASTEWAASGSRSIKVSGGTSTATSFYPFGNLVGQMARVGFIPGKTYTIGATLRLTGAQTGVLDANPRTIVVTAVVNGVTVQTYARSKPAANGAGSSRAVVTFTVPSNAENLYVRLMNGSMTQPVWWDDLTFEEGATDGSYFDGFTPGARWDSTPNGSPSSAFVVVDGLLMGGLSAGHTVFVPVLAGRLYTLSAWTASSGPAFSYRLGAGPAVLVEAGHGQASTTITPGEDQILMLTVLGADRSVSGLRVHDGPPDGKYFSGSGNPTKVFVEDPTRTLTRKEGEQIRGDYQIILKETGRPGIT